MKTPTSRTLSVGSAAPDFSLPSIFEHREAGLWEALLEGPVVVEFVRGTWCPEARKRFAALEAARAELEERGAKVFVVVAEDPFTARRYFSKHPRKLMVVIDESREICRAWGVHQRFGIERWNFARPSTFVIDQSGYVRSIWVAPVRTEPAPIEGVLETLDALAAESRGRS